MSVQDCNFPVSEVLTEIKRLLKYWYSNMHAIMKYINPEENMHG